MANYSLKSFLRQTLNPLLREFFEEENVLSDFKWTIRDKNGHEVPLPETDVNGLAEAIGQIDEDSHAKLISLLKDITSLADENIISTMIEHGKKPGRDIDLAKEFSKNEIEGCFDRVMWVYLRHKDLFKYTHKYIQVINANGSRDFLIEARPNYKDDDNALKVFKQSIIKHYKGKGRGKKCIIDSYHRNDDTEQYCYYIFHEDCVKSVLDFNEKGDDVVRNPQHSLFENIFFFEPKTGNLRIHATGEKNTEQLADLFCVHILELDGGRPNKNTEYYDMSKILAPDYKFKNESYIEKVNIKEIICDMGNNEELVFKMKGREEKGLLLLKRMNMAVKSYGVDLGDITIVKLRFQVVFKAQKGIKRKTRTREIVLPNKTNLADDYYDNLIRKHIEENWKFTKSQLSKKYEAA